MSETVVNKPVEAEVIPASDCVVETTSGRVHAKSKMSVGELTSIGLMTAILIVMSFTPLGYFRTLGLSISLMMIPVAIGAMIIGPKAGLWLGLVFGATSFYQVLTAPSAFTSALFSISPLYTFLVCVPTRALMGWLTGVLFQLIHKVDRTNTFSYFAGGFLAAFLNTLLFMGTLVLLFWNTDYIQGLNQTFGNVNPLVFVVLFVGVNGALEMPASCVAGGIVSKALSKAVHKNRA